MLEHTVEPPLNFRIMDIRKCLTFIQYGATNDQPQTLDSKYRIASDPYFGRRGK